MTGDTRPPPPEPTDPPRRIGWWEDVLSPVADALAPYAPGRAERRIRNTCVLLAILALIAAPLRHLGTATDERRYAVTAAFVLLAVAAHFERDRDHTVRATVGAALLLGMLVYWAGHGATWGFAFAGIVVASLVLSAWRRRKPPPLPRADRDPLPPFWSGLPLFLHRAAATIAVVLVVKAYAIEAMHVPTDSMNPTLLGARQTPAGATRGDHLLMNRPIYRLRDPRRWEIVVFEYPLQRRVNFVKRVVGLPGEQVEIRDGDIWVNGEVVRKPHAVQEGLWFALYDPGRNVADSWQLSEDAGWRRDGDGLRAKPRGDSTAFMKYIKRLRTHDLRVSFTVIPDAGGAAVAEITSHGLTVLLTVPASSETDLSPVLEVAGAEPVRFEARLSGTTRVQLAVVDGHAVALIDGAVVAETPLPPGKRGRPQVRIGITSGEMHVRDIELERDLQYEATGQTSWQVPEDGFVVLGDNTKGSQDSRLWTVSEFEVRGRDEPFLAQADVPDDEGQIRRNVVSEGGTVRFVDVDGVTRLLERDEIVKERHGVPRPFVRREHLLGRAALIYWPLSPFRARLLP